MSDLNGSSLIRDSEGRYSLLILGVLIILGYISTFTSLSIVAIWGLLIIYSLFLFFTGNSQKLWYTIAITPALETYTRVLQYSAIPYEIGKYYIYIVIVLMLISG